MRFGELIQAYMKERKLTYRGIADEIGVDHCTIHRMVKGEPVRMDVVIKLFVWILAPPSTPPLKQ